jgi:hypothetical protein
MFPSCVSGMKNNVWKIMETVFLFVGFSFLLYVQECSNFVFLTLLFLFTFLGELYTSYVLDTAVAVLIYCIHICFILFVCLCVGGKRVGGFVA